MSESYIESLCGETWIVFQPKWKLRNRASVSGLSKFSIFCCFDFLLTLSLLLSQSSCRKSQKKRSYLVHTNRLTAEWSWDVLLNCCWFKSESNLFAKLLCPVSLSLSHRHSLSLPCWCLSPFLFCLSNKCMNVYIFLKAPKNHRMITNMVGHTFYLPPHCAPPLHTSSSRSLENFSLPFLNHLFELGKLIFSDYLKFIAG